MDTDPLSLVPIAVDLLNAEDWRGVAKLCHPGSLSAFKRQLLESYSPNTGPVISFERFVDTTGMPPEEVARERAEYGRITDPELRLRRELPGVRSFRELQRMAPSTVFARWLAGQSARAQVQELLDSGDIDPRDAADALQVSFKMWNFIALGMVPDGDDVAHVVYRFDPSAEVLHRFQETLMDAGASPDEIDLYRRLRGRRLPGVVTCLRDSGGVWRLLAGYSLFGDAADLQWTSVDNGDARP